MLFMIQPLVHTHRTELLSALHSYRKCLGNVNKIGLDLSNTLSHKYKNELSTFINAAKNVYTPCNLKGKSTSLLFYSLLILPNYIDLANAILEKLLHLIKFDLEEKTTLLLDSLPDTRYKRLEAIRDADKYFSAVKYQLTDRMPFSSVISDYLIGHDFLTVDDNLGFWYLLHLKSCKNQLIIITRNILNIIINKIIIPILVSTASNLLKS